MFLTLIPTFYYCYSRINIGQRFNEAMAIPNLTKPYNVKIALFCIFIVNYVLLNFFGANDAILACVIFMILFAFHYANTKISILESLHHSVFHYLMFFIFLLNTRSLKWVINEILFVQRLPFVSYLLILAPLLLILVLLVNTKIVTKTYASIQNDLINHDSKQTILGLFVVRTLLLLINIVVVLVIKAKQLSVSACLTTSLYTLIILVGFILINLAIDKMSQLLFYRFKYEALKKAYLSPPAPSTIQQELRQLRHDYQKTVSLLNGSNTIKTQTFSFKTETKNHSNHEILNTLIQEYDVKAADQNIFFKGSIYWDYATNIDPFDVLRIFQNALDNAFEAAVKADKPSIVINTHQTDYWITYTIENAYDGHANPSLTTSKTDDSLSHGYGTRIIKSRMTYYEGIATWQFNPSTVCLTLKFPKVSNS